MSQSSRRRVRFICSTSLLRGNLTTAKILCYLTRTTRVLSTFDSIYHIRLLCRRQNKRQPRTMYSLITAPDKPVCRKGGVAAQAVECRNSCFSGQEGAAVFAMNFLLHIGIARRISAPAA